MISAELVVQRGEDRVDLVEDRTVIRRRFVATGHRRFEISDSRFEIIEAAVRRAGGQSAAERRTACGNLTRVRDRDR